MNLKYKKILIGSFLLISVLSAEEKRLIPNNKNTVLTIRESQDEHFQKVWKKIKDDLAEGSELYEKQENAPIKTRIFGKDKKDIQEEIDSIINDIIDVLLDDNLLEYKEEISDINQEIEENNLNLMKYKEERISAPIKSYIHKTKDGYDKKIKNTNETLIILNHKIILIQQRLQQNFLNIGVNLNEEQIEALLSRVDSEDIIKISLIMNILKKVNKQISSLMQDTNENLIYAKRYYGMHLLSLSLVLKVQQDYIDKVERKYIPRIDKILVDIKKIIDKTFLKTRTEKDSNSLKIYKSNLEAQRLTQSVAYTYRKQLLDSIKKMKEAKTTTTNKLLLAENTYTTVSLSSGLYAIVSETQLMFEEITKLQMPDIIPFENIQMEKKYKELTLKLLD